MNVIDRVANSVRRLFQRFFPQKSGTPIPPLSAMPSGDYFELLKLYYLNNGLYEEIAASLRMLHVKREALKPLRNPAYRIVEFYASKLWGGNLQVIADNKSLIAPIQQVWKWSNWSAQRQVFARWLGIYGNVFVKVAQTSDGERVFYQLIQPQYVRDDFMTDERGFLTFLRIDLPVQPTPDGTATSDISDTRTRTEVWDKAQGTYRVWESHTLGNVPLEELGTPDISKPLSDFGIDFIPIVHTKLRDVGEKWGVGAFVMGLDKIDEANLLATRMHQMLFRNNRNTWALKANASLPDGRPLPAPKVSIQTKDEEGADPQPELGDDRLVSLPGYSELQSLVPNVNYAAALEVLRDQMAEIEKDCPELAYYRIREMREVSGKAVQLLLTDATDRLQEARDNAEAGLMRLDEMALTIGANARLKGFSGLGTFETGSFEHSFAKRDVIPVSESEMAETIKAETSSEIPLVTAVRRNGWSEDDIKQMEKDRSAEEARVLAQTKAMMDLEGSRTPTGANG